MSENNSHTANLMESYQKSLETIANAVRSIYQALHIERCAGAMGCDTQTAYAYQVDQAIPTKRLLKLLAFARESLAAAEPRHKIASEFASAAGVKVIDPELVEHFNKGMDALNNGGKLEAQKKDQCPHCRSDLFTERTARGLIVLVCRRCFGAGALNA